MNRREKIDFVWSDLINKCCRDRQKEQRLQSDEGICTWRNRKVKLPCVIAGHLIFAHLSDIASILHLNKWQTTNPYRGTVLPKLKLRKIKISYTQKWTEKHQRNL